MRYDWYNQSHNMRDTKHKKRQYLPYVGGALLALFFIGGITGSVMWYYGQSADTKSKQAESSKPASLNTLSEADRKLLEGDLPKKLLVHNQQAIELLDIELAKGQSPALRKDAATMKATREKELVEIKSLLDGRGEPYQNLKDFPQQSGHDMYPTYTGMVLPEELSELRSMPAASVDKMFLEFMITHVNGSLQLTTDNKDYATSEESIALVKSITQTRQAESATLDGHQSQHSSNDSSH